MDIPDGMKYAPSCESWLDPCDLLSLVVQLNVPQGPSCFLAQFTVGGVGETSRSSSRKTADYCVQVQGEDVEGGGSRNKEDTGKQRNDFPVLR